jgi:ribonuclease E
MAERPTAEEPPIAAVEAPAEAEPEKSDEEKPKPKRTRAKASKAKSAVHSAPDPVAADTPLATSSKEAAPAKPARRSRSKKAAAAEPASADAALPSADNDQSEAVSEGGEPRRGGWWQRTFG